MPSWVPTLLKLAAVYNLAWGTFVVLYPRLPFDWLGLDVPNYPSIVQCLGMVIGVYGIGYWIAARDAATHWPIVLVGLLGKVFGPIGFVYTAFHGNLPWSMGLTILTNDVAWWLPFCAILVHAARIDEARLARETGLSLEQALRAAILPDGQSVYERSFQSPLLLVCVRHLGCTFCREMLADLGRQRDDVIRAGLTPVVVSMGTVAQAAPMLLAYGLNDVAHLSDPERRLYRALELPFGSFAQLFGCKTVWRAVAEGVVLRFGFGRMVGNGLQLSGTFVVRNGIIEQAHRHTSTADRADFKNLACGVTSGSMRTGVVS
ncbi:AhpC/TSA family protein [Schlesneria paludicola]|uniref:AhpC/TSA family protein n=1 Tax=Schlesneria paludicola TaxID=360056 RepID=UPI00029B0E0B|nr:AhpC/TSA family protein [Schlesneria paludicola]